MARLLSSKVGCCSREDEEEGDGVPQTPAQVSPESTPGKEEEEVERAPGRMEQREGLLPSGTFIP